MALVVKSPPANSGEIRDVGLIPAGGGGGEDLLEKDIATHSNILAWIIPWTEEPGGVQFIVSKRVGHD